MIFVIKILIFKCLCFLKFTMSLYSREKMFKHTKSNMPD